MYARFFVTNVSAVSHTILKNPTISNGGVCERAPKISRYDGMARLMDCRDDSGFGSACCHWGCHYCTPAWEHLWSHCSTSLRLNRNIFLWIRIAGNGCLPRA